MRRPSPSVLAVALAMFGGCRCGAPSAGAGDAGNAAPGEDASASEGSPQAQAATASACRGAELALERAIIDPECAITMSESVALRAVLEADAGVGAPRLVLRQDAEREPDGRVRIALVNAGPSAIALPLSYHERVPAFSVIAEDERRALFELRPPTLEVERDSGADEAGARPKARFARVVLPPGGMATARLTIDPTVVKRLDPCDAGPACAPARLAPGRYVLHVGQLVADVEAGAPARVAWDAP